jgi:hypothetical protein
VNGPTDPAPSAWSRHRGRRWLYAIVGFVLAAFAVVAFIAYGAGTTGGTPRQQMRSWISGTGFGNSIGTLQADAARVTHAVRDRLGTGAIRADCGTLLVDAQTANTELPSPDPGISRTLYAAYGLEGEAANNCYSAGATNTSLLAKSARERAQANILLQSAFTRAQILSGQTVSTTTTTSLDSGGILG